MKNTLAYSVGMAFLLPVFAWAGSIQSVTGSVQGGGEVVRIVLDEPLSQAPTGFAVQSPARIALDFLSTTNGLPQSLVELNQGNLNTANVVEASGRTRVVLNLKSATNYRTELDGNAVLVYLDPVKTASAVAPISTPVQVTPAPAPVASPKSIRDVDFRRTSDGAGRLVVALGSAGASADVRNEGKGLVVELSRSSLPDALMRRLDVVDFGTPVQLISSSQKGDKVRLKVDLKGEWEHSAYQSDDQFVLEVREKKIDPTKLTQGPGFSGERLSLNFQNIEVRALLQVIADFTNFNIVTSDTVGGALTLRLKDVPWDQALNIIMEAKGLGMKKNGNVLWIAPREEIDERTKKDLEAARSIEQLETLRTQGFQINYAKAEELVKKFTESQNRSGGVGTSGSSNNRFLSERGSAIAEERTNQIFITDTPTKLEEIAELLKKLDVPVRQVLIEARIVEARDSFGRSLGVKFGGGYLSNRSSVGSGIGSGSNNGGNNTGTAGTNTGNPFVNLPALLPNTNAASLAFSVFNSEMSRFLSLELSAMESEGVGKIVSNPRLMTADKSEAEIKQGQQIPFRACSDPNKSSSCTTDFKDAVLSLKVIPQITPEGDIIMDLEVNKDSVGDRTDDGLAINTKSIKTQVLVENGGTLVIGGIFEMEESNQVNKVPVLGDIPVMGNLFKNRTRQTEKREMLVFITPRMVTDAIANR
ncbi:type IV pilus secretin PilQ [Comamonas denitrificans]|uniref:type IV pilus secretin PilQ n=1 Tax=Comamonas denitrificans TaxID=117506 RepID=UPI003607B97E